MQRSKLILNTKFLHISSNKIQPRPLNLRSNIDSGIFSLINSVCFWYAIKGLCEKKEETRRQGGRTIAKIEDRIDNLARKLKSLLMGLDYIRVIVLHLDCWVVGWADCLLVVIASRFTHRKSIEYILFLSTFLCVLYYNLMRFRYQTIQYHNITL